MAKTKDPDAGRKAYEVEIAEHPKYRCNDKPRPAWEQLSLAAQANWQRIAEDGDA